MRMVKKVVDTPLAAPRPSSAPPQPTGKKKGKGKR